MRTLESEQARAQAAASYRAVAIQCEEGLTRLARLAAKLLGAPAALVTIVDQERIWLEARHGVEAKFAPLEPGLCASCVLQDGPWVISDAALDCRTKANSLVSGPPGVRFYIGIPLLTADGHNIGALAIIDFEPRQPTASDITGAQDLATVVMQSLEQKRRLETARAQRANELAQREQREARIRVLMRELAHRSKNLLAVVQAIARQTAGPNPLVQKYADGLSQRIKALADSHELLAVEDWFGTSMRQLLTRQLGHLLKVHAAQITLNGPSLFLTAKAAQNVGLAIHELKTNAVKYGALSTSTGSVEISWKLEGTDPTSSRLQLSWQERLATPLVPGARTGFGSVVLTRLTPAALDGTASYTLCGQGMIWVLDVPWAPTY